jgi:uncharacterized membrane protein YcaP (DUF421 family)
VVVVFRVLGKRTLDAITLFDFVLLLIITEGTQQALLGDDRSVTNGVLVVSTLVLADKVLAVAANPWQWVDRVLNDVPLVPIEGRKVHRDRIKRSNLSLDDELEAARKTHGLEPVEHIKYAVLERDGTVSTVPKRRDPAKPIPARG